MALSVVRFIISHAEADLRATSASTNDFFETVKNVAARPSVVKERRRPDIDGSQDEINVGFYSHYFSSLELRTSLGVAITRVVVSCRPIA